VSRKIPDPHGPFLFGQGPPYRDIPLGKSLEETEDLLRSLKGYVIMRRHELVCLIRQAAQPRLVLGGRHTNHEMFSEFAGQLPLQAKSSLIVDDLIMFDDAQRFPQVLGGEPLHPDEETAAMTGAAGPPVNFLVDLLPAAEVEVTDAEIRTIGKLKSLLENGEKRLLDVVENARHLVVILPGGTDTAVVYTICGNGMRTK